MSWLTTNQSHAICREWLPELGLVRHDLTNVVNFLLHLLYYRLPVVANISFLLGYKELTNRFYLGLCIFEEFALPLGIISA